MTRKDYAAIAAGFKAAKEQTSDILGSSFAIRIAASNVADACKLDNPRFDRGRFMLACGFSLIESRRS